MTTVAEIAIIIVAFFEIILLVLLIGIAFAIWRLLKVALKEAPPLFGAAKRTTTTVEGTVDFVSTTLTNPLIRMVSLTFAVTRFLQVLLERSNSQREA